MVILVSLPTAFLYDLYGTLLRAIGRANVALMELVTAVTINIALDYCFVAKLRWSKVLPKSRTFSFDP